MGACDEHFAGSVDSVRLFPESAQKWRSFFSRIGRPSVGPTALCSCDVSILPLKPDSLSSSRRQPKTTPKSVVRRGLQCKAIRPCGVTRDDRNHVYQNVLSSAAYDQYALRPLVPRPERRQRRIRFAKVEPMGKVSEPSSPAPVCSANSDREQSRYVGFLP